MFAETYVFDKQSLPPFHCGPQKLNRKTVSPSRAWLLPKLRHQFAEFLNQSLPKRLRILILSTCVGLRYGIMTISPRSFSRKQRVTHLWGTRPRIHASGITTRRICLPCPPTRLNGHPTGRCATFLRHSIGSTIATMYRNINLFSIDYSFRTCLRIRLTLGGFAWPRNP